MQSEDFKGISTMTLQSTCGKTLRVNINIGLETCEFVDVGNQKFYAPCPLNKERNPRIKAIKFKIYIRDEDVRDLVKAFPLLKTFWKERKNLHEHTLYSRDELYHAMDVIQASDITWREPGLYSRIVK